MHLASALLILLVILLLIAMGTDLRSRIIPNGLNLAIALLAPLFWWASGLAGPDILMQIAIAATALIGFGLLFALGMMGGGDVKLIAALALWLPPGMLLAMLVWMAVGGGALTLVTLIHHRWKARAGRPEVPYGVAIAVATILVMANDILTSLPA